MGLCFTREAAQMSVGNAKSAADKRKDKRISLIQEIECEGEAGTFQKRLADISYGGMFIDTLTAFAPGTIITVRFRLANSDKPVVVTAKVLYVQDKIGTGVKFLDLRPEDKEKIRELIHRLAAKKRVLPTDTSKSSRVMVNIPVTMMGTESDGASFEEEATIVTLARNGARIRTERNLDVDMTIFLHTSNGSKFEARIVWVEDRIPRSSCEIAIQCRGLAHALGFNFP